MYVCVCNAVTDSDIRNAVKNGARTLKQLGRATDCGITCGSCHDMAVDILNQALSDKQKSKSQLPILQMA